ncbi:hypothetical protein H6G64_34510 [Calothrix sp. FACHB-156]|nr:hypothetical protein [Calothrix sp. FACHB-156]
MTEEDRSANVGGSALSSAIITGDRNTATITITNYYYRENTTVLPVDSTDAADEILPCPYRGLFHFGPDDAEFFFGREVFVEELFAATKSRKFIPVLGASGSGKSSVVLAGLVPKLQKQGDWKFTHFRPGSEPFQALAESLVPLYEPDKDATEQMFQARRLAEYFANGSVPLQDVFSKIKRNYPNHRVLLIADQFEELYTLCADQKIRHSFLDTLLACFQSDPKNPDNNTVLVGTMRADFLGNILSYRPLADVLQNADIKLGPMNREELSHVIEKPVSKLSVTFQDGLVKRILEDVEDNPGNLPLLEFALTQLWKRRTGKQLTHAAYEEIGEVKGALARHADENYSKLSATEQEQVRRIFIQLVRPGEGTEDTRRLATKAELGEARWELVKQLADNRLVVTSQNAAKQETVEVVHEALIRNWGKFRQWMDADRSFRVWQDRLRSTMYQWEQTQRDEGALLRGAALVEAEEKLKQRREDISAGEQEFIQASVALRDREQKKRERARKLIFIGLGSFSVVVLSLMTSQQQARINKINEVRSSAEVLLTSNQNLDALIKSIRAGMYIRSTFGVDTDTQGRLLDALQQAVNLVREKNRLGGDGSVNSVAFSPNGKTIATATYKIVKIWHQNGTKFQELPPLKHNDWVNDVAFSPNGKTIATTSNKIVKLWSIDGEKFQEYQTLKHNDWVNDVVFSRDGKTIATASNKIVKLWSIDGEKFQELPPLKHDDWVNGVAFSPDGKTIATASNKIVKLWSIEEAKKLRTFQGHKDWVKSVAFSPDGNIIASASGDRTIKLWRKDDEKSPPLTLIHDGYVNSVAFSHDGKTIASGSKDKTVKLWGIDGKLLHTFTGHQDGVNSVAFSPEKNENIIASASEDNTVKLWELSNNDTNSTNSLEGHNAQVNSVAFSPDGKTIATASGDKTVKLWSTNGKLQKTLNELKNAVKSVAFSPDSNTIAAASENTVKFWSRDGQELPTVIKHSDNDWVNSIAFSPDGNTIATASDQTAKLWDREGKLLNTLSGHTNIVSSIAFSPDGDTIATASYDTTVKLWNKKGKFLKTLGEHTNIVNSIAFSPDGNTIATVSNQIVKLWDKEGKLFKTITEYPSSFKSVAFSPDNKTIATVGNDKTLKIWSMEGKMLRTLRVHNDAINSVVFSPDGKTIATASNDKTVILWNSRLETLDNLLKRACDWAGDYLNNSPNISPEDRQLCKDN